ncbi:putative membrane protein [Clostridioides difficile P31]|nr:putative membrane protein [Clostridioides difficile P45]EQK88758.1 putative membrane protein [Clostridioides difficile P31]
MSRNSVIVISITLEYNIIIYLEIYDVIYGLVINVIIK